MKLACTSGAFHRVFESGDLTQLEFLDAAAREMACDGVVLDDRHFPRTDADYLAQLKKTATDLGLSIAAVTSDDFFTGDEGAMRAAIDRALALGAPLLAGRLGAETAISWSEQLAKLGTASALAKSANVTLALRNAAHTFAASAHDCKRVTKETDSAWLRYGLDPAAFDAASDPQTLASKTVLLWWDTQKRLNLAGWEAFRGFVVLDHVPGDATIAEIKSAILLWKIAQNSELNRT
ncbi:MAG: TIM barrel protein [Candidatus Aquilonibacter sp.]